MVRHTSLRLVGIGRGSCWYRSRGAVDVEKGGGDKLRMAALLATGSVRLELSQAWKHPPDAQLELQPGHGPAHGSLTRTWGSNRG